MRLRLVRIPALSSLIHGLHHADTSRRQLAAREIFRRGCESARPVIELWLRDPEISSLAGLGPADAKSLPPGIAVGLAVERDTFGRIRAAGGSPRLARVPPEHDAIEFELHFPGGVRLAILAPRRPNGNGAIARYLRKFGEGIQQVEIRVRDVDRAAQLLRARFGLVPIYPAARPGADGARVNFLLAPAQRGKILVELVELP